MKITAPDGSILFRGSCCEAHFVWDGERGNSYVVEVPRDEHGRFLIDEQTKIVVRKRVDLPVLPGGAIVEIGSR